MMSQKLYKEYPPLAATTSAVSWTITIQDEADVKRIALVFDAAPTTSESVTITLDSANGAAYDVVLRSVDPSVASATSVDFEEIPGIHFGDALIVEYTNTDGNSITGSCVYDIN